MIKYTKNIRSFIKIINRTKYSSTIEDHYNSPRNVGSFDKNDKDVGTGLVGAPACIHEDTVIAVADGRRNISVKKLYLSQTTSGLAHSFLENKITQVWSYNIKDNIYEIKNAKIIKNKFKKSMKKIILDDDSFIICTCDHKFLLKNNNYLEVENIRAEIDPLNFVQFVKEDQTRPEFGPATLGGARPTEQRSVCDSIVPFKRGHSEQCNDYNHKIKRIEDLEGEFDCYDLQVEENNNFAVITKETNNIHNGIIIKNCGDVMKIQIRVKDGIVTDSAFKVFGCGSAIASSSLATEWVKGSNIDDALKISNRDIAKHLKSQPVKNHCSMLSEDAIKAAINDYKKKNNIQ